jgi:hypothetical protein
MVEEKLFKKLAKKELRIEKGKETVAVDTIKKEIVEVVGIKLGEMAHFILTKSQEHILKNDAVFTGFLLRSGEIHKEDNLHYTVLFSAPYSASIEFGARPHFVSARILINWVRKKLGISNIKKATSIAYAISNSIAKNGTDPKPFLRPAIDEAIEKYR